MIETVSRESDCHQQLDDLPSGFLIALDPYLSPAAAVVVVPEKANLA